MSSPQQTMDCVIPHHSVRNFCSSIIACSKIGKDLYVDFDPIDGLTLRTLNEAKSAYVCFKYEPSFFERCTAPPLELFEKSKKNSRKRDRSQQSPPSTSNDHDDAETNDSNNNDDDDDGHFTCRLSIKALTAAVRQRKNVQSLRIHVEEVASSLHLSFEYFLALGGGGNDYYHDVPGSHNDIPTSLRVVHRIPIADYPVVIISAVASPTGASELLVRPKLFLQLLDPLSRIAETALVIPSPTSTTTDNNPQIYATCFQHMDAAGGDDNALLGSHLQTETRLSFQDLEEVEFVDDRIVNNDDDDDDDEEEKPENVNESVILVFSRKEAKAILQWASTTMEHQALRVSFHWGGKPLVMEQRIDTCKVELVLATLHYKLIGSGISSKSQN